MFKNLRTSAFNMTDELKLKYALDAISKHRNGSKALEILSVITYFAPENIHTEILSSFISDKNELKAATQLLKQYSIIYFGQDKTIINIDRTVQKIMISVIEKDNANLKILEQTSALFAVQGVNSTNLDHSMSVWSHIVAHRQLIEKFSTLSSLILIELNRQIRHKEGEEFGWKTLDLMNKTLGNTHSGTIVFKHNFGSFLGEAGKHKKALEILIPLYHENMADPSRRAIRSTLFSIARELGELSRFHEALKIYEENLLCNQTVSEANDDLMLSAWHDYSHVLYEMGNYHRASEILKQILRRRSQMVDKEDNSTLPLKSALAHILIKKGDYSEALRIFETVFDELKQLLGVNHANTLRTKRDIALAFQHQGRLDEALAIYEEVTEKFKQVLGYEHPDTLAIQADTAALFQQRGEFQRALDTYRYIYQKQCQILGKKHTEPLRVKYHIATILLIQRKQDEGIKILQEVYEAYIEVFGPRHPETLDLKYTLDALNNVHREVVLETIYSAVCEGNLNRVKHMIQCGIDINSSDLSKKTPLHYAAQFGHANIVKLLLEKGAIYNAQNKEGHTPFQITENSEIKNFLISVAKLIKDSKEGNHEQISKYIAELRGILNAKDNDGSNALHWAAHNGHKDIVKLLLDSGADITQVTNKGNSALHIATSKGHREIIENLLQHITRHDLYNVINAKTTIGGVTAIHVAAKTGSLEIVKSLLEHGAIYSIKDKQGKTPFDLSNDRNITNLLKLSDELFQDAKSGNPKIITKLQHVENVFRALTNARNGEGNTLLQVVITNKHQNIASQFLEMVRRPDHIEPWPSSKWSLDQLQKLEGIAKFYVQSSKMYLPMLRSISHPYDSEENVSQWKTLKEGSYYLVNAHKLVEAYKACTEGSIDNKNLQAVNASLVELEFDPEHMTVGYTDEAYGGQVECFVSKGQSTKYYKLLHSKLKKDVRLFVETVERNIDLPIKKFLESLEKKLEPITSRKLFKAIENNDYTAVEDCIEKGVAINSKNTDGAAPLHYAVNKGNISIIDKLLKNGADVTQVTTKGNTPLHIATSKGCNEIVEVLLQHISPDKLDNFINAQTTIEGTASLHVAAKNGSVDIVKSLLKHGAIFNIENKEGKQPIHLSRDQNIIELLKLTNELFYGVRTGNMEIIIKLQHVDSDEFTALTNARDNQRNTLLQNATINKHKNIQSKLLDIFQKQHQIQSWSRFKCKLNLFKTLRSLGEKHIEFSGVYLPMLRFKSDRQNEWPWKTVKEGSYYLTHAHDLVEVYKNYKNGIIDDKNIQVVNDTLVELQFDPKYNSVGYTDEAYGGTVECFVSEGQGRKYYKMLHSESTKDVRLFVEMVECNIDIPVIRFIETMQQELQSILSEQLFKAIENNNHTEVEECIREGVAINSKNTDGGTPLHYAVNNGNLGIVNILLKHEADVTEVTAKGNTPLHIASSKGHTEIVQFLLQYTSQDKLYFLKNAQTTVAGTTALHVAVKNGFIDVVKSLLKHGAIYNIRDREGKTPLDFSKNEDITFLLKRIEELFQDAKIGNPEIVSKLQHAEVDEFTILTNAVNNEGNILLQVAIYNKYKNMTSTLSEVFGNINQIQLLSRPKSRLEQFEMLQEVAKLCINAAQLYLLKLKSMSQLRASEKISCRLITLKDGFCYLGNAYSLVKIYKWCTENSIHDVDIQAVDDMLIALEFDPTYIITFYINEVYHEQLDEQLEFLLTEGRGRQYYKLLHSGWKKDVSLFIEMVERNIEIPVKNFFELIKQKLQYIRPEKLFEAIENNDLLLIETSIRNGVEVNSKNTNGRTPLHYAVHNGNLDIVNILLKNGADATQITIKGNTPLHIATSKNFKEIVEVLLQYISHDKSNGFINAQTVGGTTALHVAAKNGSWDLVMCLLKYGAIYNKRNKEGKMPLDLSQNPNIINLLKLSTELFQDAKKGNPDIMSKLQHMELDKLIALVNACNDQGKTLQQVATTNNHKYISNKLSAMLEEPNQMQSWFTPKLNLDQLEKLKESAELHIQYSQSYLQILRNASQMNRSEKNSFPWATLKAGSYYLQNLHKLVEVYKEYMHGSIDDGNIQAVNYILGELEFDPKHITSGFTDEAFDGKVECFVSKGQGTKYYDLLHSDSKKDIRSFVEMVQSNVDIRVKKFLELTNEKFRSVLSEMLFVAIENNNYIEVKNCLREELVVNLRSIDLRSPLHHAINSGNINIINTLLKHGADVNHVANNGDTSLHIASSKGHKRVVEVLLQHICPDKLSKFINAQTVVDNTSLHIAAENGCFEVVESLLKHGAIYNIKNRDGKTPLDLSKDENITNLLNLIEILFEDAKSGNFKMIHKLKTHPFKFTTITNTRNRQGKTLVQVTVSNGHQNLAAKLDMFIKTRIS